MPVKTENIDKLKHLYSYEIKLIQQYFDASVEEIIKHITLSKTHLPDGIPMLQRIALATKALGTPADRKESINQFITSLSRQLFGKAIRQTDVRRIMNTYKFRLAKLPIVSDYLAILKKKGAVSTRKKKVPVEPGKKKKELKDEKKIPTRETDEAQEESKHEAGIGVKPDSPKTVSVQEIKTRDKMNLELAWSILDRNRPMLTESAIMGAEFILDQLTLELSRQRTVNTF